MKKIFFPLSDVQGYVHELYSHRNVIRSLVVKNLFGRYKNSFLGFAWHFITPIILLFVYYIVFSEIRISPIENRWIYLGSALFAFHFMINMITNGTTIITSNANIIKKIYFPREIIVIAYAISSFIVCLCGYLAIFTIMVITNFEINYVIMINLVPYMLLTFMFSLGCGLFFSSITVYIRDIQYLLSSISIVFFFTTPMYFLIDSISGPLKQIVWLNPLTYFVEAYHNIIYWQTTPEGWIMGYCLLFAITSIVIGMYTFKKLQKRFVERL